MNSANYDDLKKMLQSLREERDILQKQIDENELSIQELDCHVKSILSKDEEDFKVFSPRTAESFYRDELEQLKNQKTELQQSNNQLLHDRNKLNSIIEIITKVITDEKGCSLSLTLLSIQEEDRKRIARDLHDSSLQNLAHLVHKIELSTMFIDQDPVRAKLELAVVNKNLKQVINEIRNTIFNLRPMTFDDLGLQAAFERLFFQLNSDKQYELDLQIENVSCENNLILVTIYRIVQECLINIYKHAEANKIVFRCRQEGRFCIIHIEDNGRGFTQKEIECKKDRHFGLSLMRERISLLGGKLEISSEENVGTKIRAEIPLDEKRGD